MNALTVLQHSPNVAELTKCVIVDKYAAPYIKRFLLKVMYIGLHVTRAFTHTMYSGLKIASNWSPWATKNRPGRIEIMTREPITIFFFFFFFFFFLGLPLEGIIILKEMRSSSNFMT